MLWNERGTYGELRLRLGTTLRLPEPTSAVAYAANRYGPLRSSDACLGSISSEEGKTLRAISETMA